MTNPLQEQQAHGVTFASKVMENSMKLFELNVRMVKESIEDSSESIQHLLTAKVPEDVFKSGTERMQTKLNRMMSYVNEINAITSGFNAGHPLSLPQNNQQPFDFMFSAFDNATKGYRQWMDNGKKIAEAVEHNLAAPSAPVSSRKRAHH